MQRLKVGSKVAQADVDMNFESISQILGFFANRVDLAVGLALGIAWITRP